MPAFPSPANDSVELQLNDAGIAIAFSWPGNWTRRFAGAPTRGVFHDADGRLHPRLIITSPHGDLHLSVSASRFQPPSLVSAAVYWAQLSGFASTPENDERWAGSQALGAWSSSIDDATRLMAGVWVAAHGAIFELRLEGSVAKGAQMHELWTQLRESVRCEALPLAEAASTRTSSAPWWTRAKALQDQGLLDEAIALIEREGDIAEALLMQAAVHAARMRRALEASDRDAACDAWRKAVTCARSYASSATSGGEGAARSLERDRVLAELGPEPHA